MPSAPPGVSRIVQRQEEILDDVTTQRTARLQTGMVVEFEMDSAEDPAFTGLIGRLSEAGERPAVSRQVVGANRERGIGTKNRAQDDIGGPAEGAVP
jgi:hypothetical protein